MADALKQYEQILLDTLNDYAAMFNQHDDGLEATVVADREGKHYQLLNSGWRKGDYQFYVVFHFDIKEDKVWVQENRTDVLIAQELTERGIPKDKIVLGLQAPELRSASGYAVA